MKNEIPNDVPIVRTNLRKIYEYYSRDDIVNEIFKYSRNREVVGSKSNGSFIKRPNILQYPNDIKEAVKNGVVSFHLSVERWKNPMMISDEQKGNRIGWDLIFDIDSKITLLESKITAREILKFLKSYGIKNVGVKFSGRRGFHIIVPFEDFPEKINFKYTKDLYPELPRKISFFVREKIKDSLMESLISIGGMKRLMEHVESVEDIDPMEFVNVSSFDNTKLSNLKSDQIYSNIADVEKDWGNRHLFRAPYALNHKSWLVSLPIKSSNIMDFDPNEARMENVKVKENFLKFGDDATDLIIDAIDWSRMHEKKKIVKIVKDQKVFEPIKRKISEEMFPPCIKNILNGLSDGKKRSIFTLITFLRSCNWEWDEIEKRLLEWNKHNKKPLSNRAITTQIRWHMSQKKMNPPNCSNDLFYRGIGVCKPDETCKGIKNPMSYVYRKMKSLGYIKKKYECPICHKKFDSKRALSIHMRVHKNKK